MQDFRIIDQLEADGQLEAAVGQLSEMIVSGCQEGLAEMYFRRGKLYWRLGRRSDATSDYAKASAIDPSSPAVKALEHARDVADFFNPDLYNP